LVSYCDSLPPGISIWSESIYKVLVNRVYSKLSNSVNSKMIKKVFVSPAGEKLYWRKGDFHTKYGVVREKEIKKRFS